MNRMRPRTLGLSWHTANRSTGIPLGMIRYSPGKRLAGNFFAASDTAMRTSMRSITRPTSQAQSS